MCLVALALDQSRRFPLVLASNRDEFFKRETARLDWWTPQPGDPAVLGGRDLESGGTWLGLTTQGRLALVTNVRGGPRADPEAPSRGRIVTDWLAARQDTGDFWMRTALSGYNGFNLIAADFQRGECFWASNTVAYPKQLERGLYGLSNALLDTPWPKVQQLKARLQASMTAAASVDELASQLFAALADRNPAGDDQLPQTGVPLDWERRLSSAFIRNPERAYGTRCSTLVIAERTGRHLTTHVFERSFSSGVGVALLRRASLRNWPPRYTDAPASGAFEQAAVSDSELAAAASDEAPAVKKTRVRSLLKPVPGSRRRGMTGFGSL
ncbi:MAG TPA: NRDE family protein [Burkholderiaceae bacterium]|jgi:uncharacterized protein with NRDE domain